MTPNLQVPLVGSRRGLRTADATGYCDRAGAPVRVDFPPVSRRAAMTSPEKLSYNEQQKARLNGHYPNRLSTQFATISPGTSPCARSVSRSRSSRLGNLTCGTRRKIGTVVRPRPVFEREATA